MYRGSAIPALHGRYVFGDFGSGNRLAHRARHRADPDAHLGRRADDAGFGISSFGQDTNGEMYLVHLAGTLHRLVQGAGAGRQIPAQLSQTGCVNASAPTQPASGLIPYAPNAPFYSDGAVKARWLALPDGQRIVINTENDFEFPNGSVLMKNFSLGTTLVETRLFMRHNDGNWAGYTYEWNAGGTEATRVVGGKTVQVAGQTWEFPSEAQCLQCHSAAAGRTLGLEIGQLNGDFGYSHRAHRQPAHDAQFHRYADPGADAVAGTATRDPQSVWQRGARAFARAPIYTPIARIATGRRGPRLRISTSATPRRWRAPMPAISRRRSATWGSPMRASSRRVPRLAP